MCGHSEDTFVSWVYVTRHPKQIQSSSGGEGKVNNFKNNNRKSSEKVRLQRSAQNSLNSKKRWKNEKPNYTYQRKLNNRVGDSLLSGVRAFYSRDDVSRITTGKRQTITWKKNKKQKRILLDTMKNLHIRFLAEEESSNSYSLFCLLRPFWVVHSSLSDRYTCMCKIYENLGFIVQKLHHLKVISTINLHDLVKAITCDTENKVHVWRMFWRQGPLLLSL